MKWFGIFDQCCKQEGNILLIGMNTDLGQCQVCKRVFKQ